MKNLLLFLSFILVLFPSCKPEEELQITSISIDSTQITLNEGESITLSVKYSPSNLPSPSYDWISLDPKIATVNNGIVKAISAGTTKIRVTSTTNQSLKAECNVIVKIPGTPENPYLVYNVQDLIIIRDSINSGNLNYYDKTFKLMEDLDFLNEHYWTPIGLSQTFPFVGTFDGNGKTIKNIKIGTSNTTVTMDYAGLFGYMNGGTVKDLNVQWTNINTTGIAGGIVGTMVNGSLIYNCNSIGDIQGAAKSGGIAGNITDGEVTKCSAVNSIESVESGGIVGNVSDGRINDCHSNGTIAGTYAGDIAGIASNGTTIINCYSSGDITGRFTGGIVGQTNNNTIVANCNSIGKISSRSESSLFPPICGGIAGEVNDGVLNGCNSSSSVSTDKYLSASGGIAGKTNGLIINCCNTGIITSNSKSGGISGSLSGTIINCYSNGEVITDANDDTYCGIPYAGGIVGTANEATIINCYSASSVIAINITSGASNSKCYTGGIAGMAIDGSITFCISLNDTISVNGNNLPPSYYYFPARIANIESITSHNVFASTSTIVKRKSTTITDFPNTSTLLNGENLNSNPTDLLNDYVTSNPSYNGISLFKWKVEPNVNNGYPIFQ